MTTQEMADKIVALIKRNGGGVSFVEMVREIGDEAAGDATAMFGPPNICLWVNVSDAFVGALNLARQYIEPRSTSLLVYLADGGFPMLPIARRAPKKGYKTLHWAPVVFNLRKKPLAAPPSDGNASSTLSSLR